MLAVTNIELFTDGSSIKNPGPSGASYVIRYFEQVGNESMPVSKVISGSKGFRVSTNNRMEITAGILGLTRVLELIDDKTLEGATQINLSSDSSYFVDAVNKNWIAKWQQNNWMTSAYKEKKSRPVQNKDLWEKFISLQNELKRRNIILAMAHVDGHSGVELNEQADQLAVAASTNGSDYAIDEEYEKRSYTREDN